MRCEICTEISNTQVKDSPGRRGQGESAAAVFCPPPAGAGFTTYERVGKLRDLVGR